VSLELVAGLQPDPRGRHGGDDLTRLHLDVPLRERLLGILPQLRLEHPEELRPGLDEDHPRVLRLHVRIVLREVAPVELCEGAGRLDAGRPAADHDHVESTVLDQAWIAVCGLPALEQVVLEVDRMGKRVHREGVIGCAGGAEVVDLGAEAENKKVVRDRRDLVELDPLLLEVDRGHLRLVDRGVVVAREQVAQRVSDRGRLEQAGR
jgi:hypothetical protein